MTPMISSTMLTNISLLILTCIAWTAESNQNPIKCNETITCSRVLGAHSSCINNQCSNPFQSGCLRSYLGLEAFPHKRVCNSDDPPNAASLGLCDVSPFSYPEIRIANQDWDGPMSSAWIMQVLLSEVLRVPATVETSSPALHYNFYDPASREDPSAVTYPYEALRLAHELGGDCEKIKNDKNYRSCAHVLPMVNKVGQASALQQLKDDGIINQPRSGGNSDQYRWWIPKLHAERHPSLLSFYGMGGENSRNVNKTLRHELADLFHRPTNWATYCSYISTNNCTLDDGIAARAPRDAIESNQYFHSGSYVGHFRRTEKNNCTSRPDACTGHIVNVPCSWGNYAVPQAYHLGISVESDGGLAPNGGYGYTESIEIYKAANATRSNVLMYWWEPDSLIESYRGTDYEFVPIHLPPPTAECVDNRVSQEDRCSANFTLQVGSPMGSCDAGPVPMVVPMTLKQCNHVDFASCSPAYAALQSYQVNNYNYQQIYKYRNNDPNQDGRLAVCRWFAENLDEIRQTIVPHTYPRQRRVESFYRPLTYFSMMLAAASLVCLAICILLTAKKYNKTKVMIYAQVDFLLMILGGLFFVALAALFYSLEPSKGVCVCRQWFVAVGYSLELVPLAVKVAAVNRIVQQSEKMKKIEVKRQHLYQIVGVCVLAICIYLATWTAIDCPILQEKMILLTKTDDDNNGNLNIVEVKSFCASSSRAWQIAKSFYLSVLLLISAAIATQNRGIREEFNESQYLAFMLYSQTIFMLLRLAVLLIRDKFTQTHAVSASMSILLSTDVFITVGIYFVPKFMAAREILRDNGDDGNSNMSSMNVARRSSKCIDESNRPDSFTWRLRVQRRDSGVSTKATVSVIHEEHLIDQDITGFSNGHHQTVARHNDHHGTITTRRTLDDNDITLEQGLQEEKIEEDHHIDVSGTDEGVRESDRARWSQKVISWRPDFMTSMVDEGIRHNTERVTPGYYPQRTTTAPQCTKGTSSSNVDNERQVEQVAKEDKLLDWYTDGEPHADDKNNWLEEISEEDHLLERYYAS